MKSFSKVLAVLLLSVPLGGTGTVAFAQTGITGFPPSNVDSAASAGPGGVVTNPSGLIAQVSPGPVWCGEAIEFIGKSNLSVPASVTKYEIFYDCVQNVVYLAATLPTPNRGVIPLAEVTTSATTITTNTDIRSASQFPVANDGYYFVAPGACQVTATSGAFAAGSPAVTRLAANHLVLQATTTAAASTLAVTCDLTPPSKLTAGHGATINDITVFYGVQTTAFSSISAATVSSVSYPAAGGAAAGTVAAIGGTLTVTPGTLQTALTTSGLLYTEKIAFGTAYAVNTDVQKISYDQVFNNTAAAALTLQFGGALVHYTYVPL